MGLSKKEVAWVAHLARLELSEEGIERMSEQLSRVLDYIEKLNELDTSGVEPMCHPGELSSVFRDDVPSGSLDAEAALRNAPATAKGFFRVPRVIE